MSVQEITKPKKKKLNVDYFASYTNGHPPNEKAFLVG